MRALLILSVGLALVPALAKEVPVEPGRRESERAVKQGVDPELQKRIDQAIGKAKAFLLGRTAKTPGMLRKQAAELKARVKHSGSGKEKQAAERKALALLRCAAALEAGREPQGADAKVAEGIVPTSRYGPGEDALVGLALVQAGVPPSDPVVQAIWKGQSAADDPRATYTAAVQLMFADAMMHAPCGEAWPPPESRDAVLAWIRERAERLAAGCDGGAWTYGGQDRGKRGYSVGEAPAIGSKALERAAVPQGAHDFSNSQYAVLGLKAAALCGVRPEGAEGMWRMVVQQFLTAQEAKGQEVMLKVLPERPRPGSLASYEKGWEETASGERRRRARARGWGYLRKKATTHTMTAAGLTALLVGRSELDLKPEEAARVDEAVCDGLAWMQLNWEGNGISGWGGGVGGTDLGGWVNSYLVYGLERLGVLGVLRTVGGHDWYAEGARRLVETQGKAGAWEGGYGDRIDTAFCLLFLCRGTRGEYAEPAYEVGEVEPAKP